MDERVRFSRLRLNGFKSFVDQTELVIADGLTGVVGPNGCGKSNLLEALRWVMGETRPKAMRGGGMEDVIFAGAATRGARSFAEVTIQIDNEDRLAPATFNSSDKLEIVRRITRDAGSAFKVNSKEARARDVQMLFADASTGAHSPALVRQGQISELINAKPRNRRRVLEEAAGISGLYQRRHEAELKLNSTEQNLLRVDDVIEQLAAQLTQLARQAKQAARYREIGAALRQAEGMLLYRRWRDADEARAAAEAALRADISATVQAERAALAAVRTREEAEAALPALREEDSIASAIFQRVSVERDGLADQKARAEAAISALTGRVTQLGKDLDRETALNADADDTIARLTAEAAELQAEGEGHGEALVAAQEAAQEATALLEEHETRHSALTEEVARLAARHQSAERLVEDCTRTRDRSEREAEKARQSHTQLEATLAEVNAAFSHAQDRLTQANETAETAETLLAEAETKRAEVQSREAEARAQSSAAKGEVSALEAEVTALARLVARDTSEDGHVLDLVRVERGYETALGAALDEDLRAPIVTEPDRSGWHLLDAYAQPRLLPEGVPALSNYVTVPEVLSRRIGQIGVVPRKEGARLQVQLNPGQRLVSLEGDLWRWDGLHARAEDAPSAAALRLQQLNRLEELKQELVRAKAQAKGTSRAHEVLKAQLTELTEQDRRAREARRAAEAQVTEANRTLSKLEADRNIATGRVEALRLAVSRHEDEATEARRAFAEAQATQARLPDLEAARNGSDSVKLAVEAARMTMMSRRAALDELKHAGEARDKRVAQLRKDSETWQQRLTNAGARIAELEARRASSEDELSRAKAKPAQIAAEQDKLTGALSEAEGRRKAATEALTLAETAVREAAVQERDAERKAGEARAARAASEARLDAAKTAADLAAEQIEEAQSATPAELLSKLEVDPSTLADANRIEQDVTRLKRQRDAMGAVNLRAEEDAKSVAEEHDQLVAEKADLEAAIAKLRGGINALNREGRERLLTAFEQVNSNFSMLFSHLFGGGEANLVLVESDDPLEAGLEIMCQPPGKKLSTLSLLSGGEQTLTALALIFAVFLANPAPICVLDEVDAPLDDANVGRFCDLLDEMTRRTETRFLIITHHAVTMARMDRLFGVTMAEQGVSQLVSVDLKKAEQMVA